MNLDVNNPVFQTALDLVQETNQTFFLTGRAGTGKSTFMKHIVETVEKNFLVVAPTGIAAVNVGGVTIHSFFQFPLRPLLPNDEGIKIFWKNSEKRKIISAMDTLIIDEISMVRADLIDGIDFSLRKNGGNPNMPFGGKQVIFVGDIFQLEPVTIKGSGEQTIINEIYGNPYFYNAKVFESIELVTIELQKVYRQTDSEFVSLLDKVRIKDISQADLDYINTRVFSQSQLNENDFAITLTTTNEISNNVNYQKLDELDADSFLYVADVSGEFEESKYPTDPELVLKVGAQVIFIKNDTARRWVNGTIGQVCELTENDIKVRLKDGTSHFVEKRVWENLKYQYNKEKKKIEQEIIGTFEQYPLKLAWAITIHKSQGLTFDRVVIDFGSGTFASGQAYVALSRATSFKGLFLKQKLYSTDIYIDESIKEFAKTFNDPKTINKKLILGKEIFRYQTNNNNERIGDLYFKNAIESIVCGDFHAAYNELLVGFETVSCDCYLSQLIKNKYDEIVYSLNNNPISCTLFELDFIRAVIYFFIDSGNYGVAQNGTYQKALSFIDSYLEIFPESDIAHYLKGRVLVGFENYETVFEELELALSLKETARTHYRLGRIKEQKLNMYGVDHLYKSVLMNPTSLCSLRWFKNCCDNRLIKFETNTNKLLVNSFNNKETDEFIEIVDHLLLEGNIELSDCTILPVSTAVTNFLESLESDENLFIPSDFDFDNEDFFSDNEDYTSDQDDYFRLSDNPYYDDNLDMDEQSPDFWDSL
ncbi:MAG TPA: AAA family ATPase [Tenuifilaceae bacterium]|jgi:hypothetical protein|nr:AAA family ATPase [Bacteroidales bacterium]MDI9517368.1 AAA family ATPase [Bacteroidota bacterium]OQC61388.1 MAG: ATP-dependent RecD-like DNA helicase [Bacteroidetes bacterium ADurb.Bin008]HNV80295.1 AAA family ATPase [Tenuifilaceae bacterium]MZP81954.1 AAA family ATPase [Bacteroidales bacterium]